MLPAVCAAKNLDKEAKMWNDKLSRGPFILSVGAVLVTLVFASTLTAAPPRSFDEKVVADFYRAKTITIVVGFAPGGIFDITSRLLAKHLRRHIPGTPNVIVENRPGAGSLVAANLVYESLRKDGTFIVNLHPLLVLQQLQGREGMEFDARRYNWLGSVSLSLGACGVHRDTGITHVKQIMGPAGRVVTMGGEAPGTTITDIAAAMRAALGLKFRIIYGYSGGRPIANAVLNRELDGMCGSWSLFESSLGSFFQPTQLLNMILVNASQVPDHPWLKNAVPAEMLAPNDKARSLLKIVATLGTIHLPYAVAPGVPPVRIAALRSAFDRTLADPAFAADFEKTKQPLAPKSGEEVAQFVNELLSAKPETVTALEEALKQREGP